MVLLGEHFYGVLCIVYLLASEGYDGNVDDGLSLCTAEMAPKVPAMQCTNVALSVRSESSPTRGLASCQSVADLCASIIHNEGGAYPSIQTTPPPLRYKNLPSND